MNEPTTTIYTIGHSNHPIEEFLRLLHLHSVQTLADVRSRPTSRFHPQFRQKALKDSLVNSGIEYIYLGNELGGHPSAENMYDQNGHVIYERIATTSVFRRGIQHVGELAESTRLALMCAEGEPNECHRHPLLARVLLEQDICIQHICRDGRLKNAASMFESATNLQIPLVEPPGEDLSWKSPKRIR